MKPIPVNMSSSQESLDLQNRHARPVAVTCLSFFNNDVNKFLVGSEECLVYQGQRHGTKPGTSIQFDGHTGPITAVSAHRAAGGQVSGCGNSLHGGWSRTLDMT